MQTIYDKLLRPGQIFFAIALVGFAVLQFIYGDIVIGRAPAYPAGVPGQFLFACIWGVAFIAVALLITIGIERKAWMGLVVIALLIFVWAFLRQLPIVFANLNGGTITALGKAVALFGGALAIAGSLSSPPYEGGMSASRRRGGSLNSNQFLWIGRLCVGSFLILGGVEHFIYPQFVATLVPAWIPGAMFWTYFAAVALIAGGLGMIVPFTVRLASALAGLMIFLWVFMLHLPRAITAADAASRRNEWTAVFEALAISGIAFAIVGRAQKPMGK